MAKKNGTETLLLAKKMHNGENAFEVLLYTVEPLLYDHHQNHIGVVV